MEAEMSGDLAVAKIVLLEPNTQFAEEMLKQASSMGIYLDHFHNMLELGYLGRFAGYQAIIINQQLEKMTGREIAVHLDKILGHIPILLLEDMYDKPPSSQPIQSVFRVMSKQEGVHSILNCALNAAGTVTPCAVGDQSMLD